MQSNKFTFKALVLIMFLSLGALTANAGEGYKNLFINLKTNAHNQSGMGLAVANAMQSAGVKTTVLIGADAVNFALKKGGQSKFVPMKLTQREMITALIKKGGRVMLCGMFANFAKIDKRDVVRGVEIVDGADVAGALLAPATQTLSF